MTSGCIELKQDYFVFLITILVLATACRAEFQVNTRTGNNQTDPAIAMDANGNFVVVWSSYRQDGDSGGIFGQRFDCDGVAIGSEFQINTETAGNQTEPSVAMDSSGNFVVAWHGPGPDEEDIFAQRFDANGQPLGNEFRVNSYTDNRQLCPSAAMNNDGNFVIVWESMNIPEDANKRSICGQLYNSSGSNLVPEFVVNDEESTCRHPDVAMHNSGRFIVVWIRESTTKSVWVRHFEADGNAPFLSSKVNDEFNFTSLTRPTVAIDAMGNYVIVWDGHNQGDDYDNVYLKRYHWSHAPLHEQYLVNTQQTADQTNPSVAICDDTFIVVWEDDSESERTERNILGQRFVNQGEEIGSPIPLGDEFQINIYEVDDQKYPVVVLKENGEFITVWQSYEQDGSQYGIFGDFGPRIGCGDFSGDLFVNFSDFSVLADEWLEDENPLKADLIDDNKIDELDLGALCEQWLMPCYECNDVDLNGDNKIDFKDYALWSANWLKQGPLAGDFTGEGTVDMADLKAMVLHWAKTCE